MQRKGMELTMSTIIIAALAIIVLVVIAFIFSQSAGNFWKATNACTAQGGECQSGRCEQGYSNFFSGNEECKKSLGEEAICCKRNEDILG